MPYDIRKQRDGYHVYNQATGEDKGVSKTRAKAEAHMRAMYAHEPKKSPGMLAGGKAGGPLMALDDTYTPRPVERVYAGGRAFAPAPPKPAVEEPANVPAIGIDIESLVKAPKTSKK